MILNSAGTVPNGALINSDGELLTSSSQKPQLYISSEKGNAYYIVTNFLTISTANTEYGFLYIKNTSVDKTLHISQIRTCGTATQFWRLVKNPTTGTLISGGSSVVPENLLFSSGRTFQGTVKTGGQGFTLTDGKNLTQWINGSMNHAETDLQSAISLEYTNSIAFAVKVDTANAVVCASVLAFFDE